MDETALVHGNAFGEIAQILGLADLADPELYEHLPLPRWVVCTVRMPEVALPLLRALHSRGFSGKLALSAATEEEAQVYEKLHAAAPL